MTVLFYLVAGIFVAGLLGAAFLRLDAARLATGLRVAGPVAVGLFGVVLLLAGRAGLGGMLISGALAWYMNAQRVKAARPTPGRRSTVRSAALEMELDHDSGMLEGAASSRPTPRACSYSKPILTAVFPSGASTRRRMRAGGRLARQLRAP
jgi:hypothetical protein